MNPDPEELLNRLSPRGADRDLRARILGQVDRELAAPKKARWQRWLGPAVAAAIALAFGANVWIAQRHEARMADLCGPTAVPASIREAAAFVESVAGPESAHLLEQRLMAASRPKLSFEEQRRAFEKYLRDMNAEWKEERHEKTQEGSQNRRVRPGPAFGFVADRERHPDRRHGQPA